MAEKLISLEEFLKLRHSIPMLDARSEGEFAQNHIPEALNLPILNDEERIVVGTLYKQEGNESAVLKGFELVGPRFHTIIKEALKLIPAKRVLIYCWRGGMRSQILSWLLTMAGFEVYRLKGGYKTYRTYTYELVRKPISLLVLGGKTGAAKTVILQRLANQGEQVIDLEGLAHHKGSAFGGIGMPSPPSVEQFENLLAEQILTLDPQQPTWVENESRLIGMVVLPNEFYDHMLSAPLIELQRSLDGVNQITKEYAHLPKDKLIAAVMRIKKKLGIKRMEEAIEAIREDRHSDWIKNLLVYYDSNYAHDLTKRDSKQCHPLDAEGLEQNDICLQLIQLKEKLWKMKQ